MKKLVVVCLFLAFASIAKSQCHYYKNEVDEFTGDAVLVTEMQTLYSVNSSFGAEGTQAIHFNLIKVEETSGLTITYQVRKTRPSTFCYNRESKVMLKLDDNSVIELPGMGDFACAKADVDVNQYGTFYNYTLTGTFVLHEENRAALQGAALSKLRLYHSDGYTDIQIEDRVLNPMGGFKRHGNNKIDPQYYFIEQIACIE